MAVSRSRVRASTIWSEHAQLASLIACVCVLVWSAQTARGSSPQWTLLALETVVQFVQYLTYSLVLSRLATGRMALTRYADWFVTTPAMLFTMVAYMHFLSSPASDVPRFAREHSGTLAQIFGANAIMLLAGLMAEMGHVSKWLAWIVGFIALSAVFALVWTFARQLPEGRIIFACVALSWALYGLAFLMDNARKNIAYNVLDVIAKNALGLFLAVRLIQS